MRVRIGVFVLGVSLAATTAWTQRLQAAPVVEVDSQDTALRSAMRVVDALAPASRHSTALKGSRPLRRRGHPAVVTRA